VMFSDLVGSTALSARMDPEDLREVILAYQKCFAETVQRFGGFVAKYMGDGVLMYFGYPQAHEDDAERAVRAGLELVAAVGALKTHSSLQTRVGIATGLVVVGDLIGSGASQEQAIVGETPNLAARLQGVGEPNSVLITESTRRPTLACGTSARRSIPTARSTRSSAKWSAPLGSHTTTTCKQSSTSSIPSSPRVLRHAKTRHCLLKCCRCRTMDAIPS
jgi:class 3 adenylate cyclase